MSVVMTALMHGCLQRQHKELTHAQLKRLSPGLSQISWSQPPQAGASGDRDTPGITFPDASLVAERGLSCLSVLC